MNVKLSSALDQQLNYFHMTFEANAHERRIANGVDCIHIGSAVEQQSRYLNLATISRQHERREALQVGCAQKGSIGSKH